MLLVVVVALAALGQAVPVQWAVLLLMGFGYAVLLIMIERHIDIRTRRTLPNELN